MRITRKSMIDGIARTRDIDATQEQIDLYQKGKGLIQNIFPNLSADDREFIKTGITSEQWDAMFTDEEKD